MIHSFIFSKHFILVWIVNTRAVGMRQEYTLAETPSTHTFSPSFTPTDNFESPIDQPTFMFLEGVRKPEDQRKSTRT